MSEKSCPSSISASRVTFWGAVLVALASTSLVLIAACAGADCSTARAALCSAGVAVKDGV